MCAEVCDPESWQNLFNKPNFSKHFSPSVEGVDYPAVTLDQAYHDDDREYSMSESRMVIKQRVTKEPLSKYSIYLIRTSKYFLTERSIQILILLIPQEFPRLDIKRQEFKIITGYLLSPEEKSSLNKKLTHIDDSSDRSPSKSKSSSSRLILPQILYLVHVVDSF